MECLSVSRRNAEHYVWGTDCDAWHLLKSSRLSVIEECMPPGSSESRHYHRQSQQFFYILSGQAILEHGGRCIRLSSRQGLLISSRVRHQIPNSSKKSVRFVIISQPPSHADSINEPEPRK